MAPTLLEVDGTGTGISYVPSSGGEELWVPPSKVVRVSTDEWAAFGETLPFDTDSFDVVLLMHAAELIQQPRLIFRELWRILKPGGRAIVAFSSAKSSTSYHTARTIKMWRDYNDAQRLYIVGSYFHFSAGAPAAAMLDEGPRLEVWGAGWRGLRGYDYLNAADRGENLFEKVASEVGSSKDSPLFVVQADKAQSVRPGDGALAVMDAALWAIPYAEEEDKRLFATRVLSLLRELRLDDQEAESIALKAAKAAPAIYESLAPMSTVIATPLLAQLAAAVAPTWNPESSAQRAALREGLGLDAPRELFWKPLGQLTTALTVDDKLWLLADLLPLFDDAVYALNAETGLPLPLATLLDPQVGALSAALDVCGSVLPDSPFTDRDRQLLAIDIVARDFLPAAAVVTDLQGVNTASDDFKAWLQTLTRVDLEAFLDERKNYRQIAEENAKLAELDPEAAAAAAQDARRAAAVEAMLNDIASQLDAKKGKTRSIPTISSSSS